MKPLALADPLLDGYHTPRLRLAAPQPGNGAALLAAIEASLPLLRRFPDSLPWAQAPQDVHASEAWCQRVALVWPQGQDKIALLWLGDEVVGCAELHLRSAHCWELGFWGHPDWLGIGLYTEAMDSVLSLAFGRTARRRCLPAPTRPTWPPGACASAWAWWMAVTTTTPACTASG